MVSQPTQASVIDTPYRSCEGSAGTDWAPSKRWLSSIMPTMFRFPADLCSITSRNATGCKLWSLLLFA